MNTLLSMRDKLWYDYLEGHYTYDQVCDVFEVLINMRNQIKLEKS